MWTECNTAAAVQANNGLSRFIIHDYYIDRACFCTETAAQTKFLLVANAAPGALLKGPRRAGFCTGGRITGQAVAGFKTGRQSTQRTNLDT